MSSQLIPISRRAVAPELFPLAELPHKISQVTLLARNAFFAFSFGWVALATLPSGAPLQILNKMLPAISPRARPPTTPTPLLPPACHGFENIALVGVTACVTTFQFWRLYKDHKQI